jgi:hypothetical protein
MTISGTGAFDMSVSDTDWPASPLAAACAALTGEPAPRTLNLDDFDPALDLPGGVMTLPALREWLLRHPRAYPARDAVWRELISRARLDGPGESSPPSAWRCRRCAATPVSCAWAH